MKSSEFVPNQIAEIKLQYINKVNPSLRPKVSSARDAEQIIRQQWDINQIELREEFKILLLNRANRVLGIVNISTGGVSGTVADPKLIFAAAIKANASSIIMVHNHPSGNLSPSTADIHLTRKVVNGGKLLDISILDHIILTSENFCSLAEEGLMQ